MKNLSRTIGMAIMGPLYYVVVEDIEEERVPISEASRTVLEYKEFILVQTLFFTAFWMCIVIRIRDNHWDSYGIAALSIYLVFWALYNHLMKSSFIKGLRKNTSIDIILHIWNTLWLPIICYTMLVFLMTRGNAMYVERILPIGLNWLYVAIAFSICVPIAICLSRLVKNYVKRYQSFYQYICDLNARFNENKKSFDVILVKICCGLAIAAALMALFLLICIALILPMGQQV